MAGKVMQENTKKRHKMALQYSHKEDEFKRFIDPVNIQVYNLPYKDWYAW